MADKEATLKLTLKSDGFKAGLTDAEKAAEKAAKSMRARISKGLSDAGKEGIDALKGSLSNLKSAVMGVAGIAGGFGVVEFARRAISSEAAFKKLAFQIRAGTGEMKNWRDMQRDAQATALKFGHTSEEIGKSISDLYAAVGDPKFAQEASKVVAEFATGSHEPLETMTNLAGGLNEKFGITAKELPDVLAQVVSMGNKGGVSVGDLADKIGIIGANARGAGLEGKKGFGLLVGMLNIADNATGTLKKGIGGVTGIIEGITNNTLGESLKKNLQFDLSKAKKQGLEFDDILGQIIEKSGGSHDNLAKVFAGDQLKVVTELAKVYQEGFDSTQGSKAEKTKGGWEAYEKAIADASKSALSVADIQAEAAKEMETPEKKIATAMEKLAQVFTSEKMSHAFEQLADFLPKVIETMMHHPLLTGALLSGVPQSIVGSLGKSLFENLGKSMGSWFKGGAGGALAVGAGALGAFEGGKAIIDSKIDARERGDDNTRAAGYEATNDLSASRTMIGDRAQFAKLADLQGEKTNALQQRFDLASNMAFGGMKTGRRFDAANNRWEDTGGASKSYDRIAREQAEAALPGGSSTDKQEWADAAIRVAEADARNINTLRQALEDSQRAQQTFSSRAMRTVGTTGMADLSGATSGIGYAGFIGGAQNDRPGLGLGGEYDATKGRRNKQREAAEQQEAAKVAAQKAEFAGLAAGIGDAVGSKILSVNIVESIPLKTDGAKPAKGSDPV